MYFGCQPPLEALLAMVPGIARSASRFDQTPAFDLQLPSFGLPLVMETRLETIPSQVPYVFADPRRAEAWRKALEPIEGFRVGLAWSGSPLNTNDRNRSVPLSLFAPLGEVEGVRFLSVQKGERAGDLPPLSLGLLPTEFDDFADCAALMANLDLVITVDTGTAHLAAALGRPTWTLIPYVPDWRWMLGREDTLWYPTMRLFRQKTRGDWGDVMRRVAAALRETVDARARARARAKGLAARRECVRKNPTSPLLARRARSGVNKKKTRGGGSQREAANQRGHRPAATPNFVPRVSPATPQT